MRSRADSLKKTVAEPQPATNRLLHQMHAFDGDLTLLIRRCLSEASPKLLNSRILTAIDAAPDDPSNSAGLTIVR